MLKPLKGGGMGSLYLAYLWPGVAGALVTSLYILIDTTFIGRAFGGPGLAALDLALPLYSLFTGVGYLLGVGGAAAFSARLGKEQRIIWHCLIVGLCFAALIGLGGQLILACLSELQSHFRDYLRVLLFFTPFFIFTPLLAPLVANDGAPRLALGALSLGAGVNLILDYMFIFVLPWGMSGAALATGLASGCSTAVLAARFFSPRSRLGPVPGPLAKAVLLPIAANGLPSLLGELGAGTAIFLFNHVLVSSAGQMGIAVHGILANISLVCLALFTGIGHASQPLISVWYARRHWPKVRQVRNLALFAAALAGFVFFLCGQLFSRQIASFFVPGDGELLKAAAEGIRLYFWAFPPMGANTVLTLYYQSLEFPRHAALLACFRPLVFIPLGLVLSPRLFGSAGVWLAMPFAESLSLALGWYIANFDF